MTFIILILASVISGTNGPLVKFSVNLVAPIVVTFIRFFIAFLAILPFVLMQKETILKKYNKNLLVPNLLFAANFILFIQGIKLTSILMSQIMYLLVPLETAILGYLLLKEKLSKEEIIGLCVSTLGLILLAKGAFRDIDIKTFGTPFGNILVFSAMSCWSLYIVTSRKISKTISPFSLTLYNFFWVWIIALGFIILSANRSFNSAVFKPSMLIAFVTLGIVSTAIFFVLYQWLIKNTSAFFSSNIHYLQGVVASIAGMIFFDERFTPILFLGALFIATGSFIATSGRYLKTIGGFRWIFQ